MKNPVAKYFVLRLGLFVLVLALLVVIVKDALLAAVFAAVISFSLSLLFLRKQRDAMTTHLHERSLRKRDGMTKPGTADVENDLLDGKGE